MTPKPAGKVGFYRAYAPRVFDTLDEAIAWTTMLAEDWGLVEVSVVKRTSYRYPNGGFFVSLVGTKRPDDSTQAVTAAAAPLP
jgi:hypothetical protein